LDVIKAKLSNGTIEAFAGFENKISESQARHSIVIMEKYFPEQYKHNEYFERVKGFVQNDFLL